MKKDYFLGLSEEGFHRVAYTEWIPSQPLNPPLLCVHGLTRNGSDFEYLAKYLVARNCHVYCPDIVGRGDSDWLQNPMHYTYEQYIADMNTLIARINNREIDWIGTSMGGIIGMILASLPNTPIRRLILNDVGAQIPAKALARLAKYAGKDPDFKSIEQAKNYFKTIYADFGKLTEEQWQHFTENSVRQMEANLYITKMDHGIKRSLTKSKLAWKLLLNPHKALEGTFFDIDLWQIWRKVMCPVLIIHGQHSDLLLPDIIHKMKSIHPLVEVFEVEHAGHAPALVNEKEHEVIYQWLRKDPA